MSIVDIFITADVALIGVDTDAALPDGSHGEGCKVIFLPHISAVVAFRGAAIALACAAPSLLSFSGGFDELADVMGAIMKGSMGVAIKHMDAAGMDRPDSEPANFFLVGYSLTAGRMVGHAYQSKPGTSDIDEIRDFPQIYAPFFGADEIRALNISADKAGMKALALDQYRLVRERAPAGSPAGGRLFITEVRKDRISTEMACHFPPRPVPASCCR